MKKNYNYFIYTIIGINLFLFSGCKKFLDEKPRQNLATVSSMRDMQALLDDYTVVSILEPTVGEVSSDDYYLIYNDFSGPNLTDFDRRKYVWEENIFPSLINDWSGLYQCVYRSNIILENIENVTPTSSTLDEWNNIKGQAYFLRGKSFLLTANIWSVAYDSTTANNDLGIPLRLNSIFSIPSVRSSNQETYSQIVKDLKNAISLLPIKPAHVFRSCRPAANAMLARAYLAMRNYDSCFKYANACLQTNSYLIDYRTTLDSNLAAASYPFGPPELQYSFNDREIIYACRMAIPAMLTNTRARVDSLLYQSFGSSDLRKKIYFRNLGGSPVTYGFRGSYNGSGSLFSGIAVDEVYLMRAECFARMGDTANAMKDLNTLMKKRSNNSYVLQTATSNADALQKILAERRRELMFRGIRWMDIKRLNKEGFNIKLVRKLTDNANVTAQYELPANSPKFALPIPEDVISLSRIPQNPR
jgi:starch-binding outer membrane protein, SusD/RagB family